MFRVFWNLSMESVVRYEDISNLLELFICLHIVAFRSRIGVRIKIRIVGLTVFFHHHPLLLAVWFFHFSICIHHLHLNRTRRLPWLRSINFAERHLPRRTSIPPPPPLPPTKKETAFSFVLPVDTFMFPLPVSLGVISRSYFSFVYDWANINISCSSIPRAFFLYMLMILSS